MTDNDVISLSSDSSRPSSPFINVSEVFNDTEKSRLLIKRSEFGESDTIIASENDYKSDDDKNDYKRPNCGKCSPHKKRITHDLSESDDDPLAEENNVKNIGEDLGSEQISLDENLNFGQEFIRGDLNVFKSDEEIDRPTHRLLPKKRPVESNVSVKLTKEQRLEEKERKRREKEKIRSEKRALQERQNQIKPGNCMKFMSVVLDSSLVTCPFGGALLAAIQNTESKYEVSAQTVPFSIVWTRDIVGSEKKEEDFLVIIWQWQMFIPAVKNHTLCSQIQAIQTQSCKKSILLVIYGLNGYFRHLKNKSRKGSDDSTKGRKRKQNEEVEEFPYLTKNNIEEELIELHLLINCSHQLIESQEDLSQLVVQITKAIAETPYKLDKQKRELENLEWFAVGDSRDCVAVDKSGNGLLRLWQQQLCQFNLAGHDVAQAIAKTYPSPLALVKAYESCSTKEEGEGLLKDILVRRCQGPLSSNRRIGPELSKKVFTFFSSRDGDAPLSQET